MRSDLKRLGGIRLTPEQRRAFMDGLPIVAPDPRRQGALGRARWSLVVLLEIVHILAEEGAPSKRIDAAIKIADLCFRAVEVKWRSRADPMLALVRAVESAADMVQKGVPLSMAAGPSQIAFGLHWWPEYAAAMDVQAFQVAVTKASAKRGSPAARGKWAAICAAARSAGMSPPDSDSLKVRFSRHRRR